MLLSNIVLYLASFIAIWIGSGLIVSSTIKISHKFRIPQFFVSFVILGLLTSTPEFAVGLSSVSSNAPGIFIGNLLGGIAVLFLFVIPLLAILGKGIQLRTSAGQGTILVSLIVSILPFIVVFDGRVTNPEGVFLIASYLTGVLLLQLRHSFLKKRSGNLLQIKRYSFIDIFKVLVGVAIVFISSNTIVAKTIYFSQVFEIAPFYISLIVLSFGTNLPELTIAIRSILSGNKDIAFGDYLGSASANTMLFGIFTLMIKDPVLRVDSFKAMFAIVLLGFALLYFFAKSSHSISRKEGFILLCTYILFLILEFGASH